MKKRSLYVAYGQDNFIIGDGKDLPGWNLPKDRGFFSRMTIKAGCAIMGRVNYESLPPRWQPLPNRTNIIMTRNPLWVPTGPEQDSVRVVHSLWEALEEAEKAPGEEIPIIGGGEIYREAMNNIIIHDIHLTCVFGNFEGSVTFPMSELPFSLTEDYFLKNEEFFPKDEKNTHPFCIRSYERKSL